MRAAQQLSAQSGQRGKRRLSRSAVLRQMSGCAAGAGEEQVVSRKVYGKQEGVPSSVGCLGNDTAKLLISLARLAGSPGLTILG